MGARNIASACLMFFGGLVTTTAVASHPSGVSPDNSVYVGYRAGLGLIDLEYDASDYTGAASDNFAQGLLVGYQFGSPWAVEAFWLDVGEAEVLSNPGREVRGTVDVKNYGIGAAYRFEYSSHIDFALQAGVAESSRDYHYYADLSGEDEIEPYAGAEARWSPFEYWQLRGNVSLIGEDQRLVSLAIVKYFRSRNSSVHHSESTASLQADAQKHCDDFVILFDGVKFARSSVALDAQAQAQLDQLATQLMDLPPDIHIEVRAHSDPEGTESYNYSLSMVRARAVRDYLASQGVPLSRISAEGYGEWGLAASAADTDSPNAQRRAELVLVGVEKYLDEPQQCGELVRTHSTAMR